MAPLAVTKKYSGRKTHVSNDEGMFTGAKKPQVNSIPLSDVDTNTKGSIGELVSNATEQISSLMRAEIELAKAEIQVEAKKVAIGGGLFTVAGVIALYSSFFFFFALAEVLKIWLWAWAAYLIIFFAMLLFAALLAFIGFRKVKQIKAPKKTIESVAELRALRPGTAEAALNARTIDR